MFNRILIANRGEIACRVISTARRMGISTVAVYSEADRDALHVQLADEAIFVGEAPAAQSYLRGEAILDAAVRTGAEAIHPGYGFLSENAGFARACDDAQVVFIGPGADAIDAMGSKARAKAIMADAGVPLIPGYHGDDQSDAVLQGEANAMGYPVLLKATAGGGGKGMRAVHSADEFADALGAARRESAASFSDDRMLVEKLIQRPRHVEIQVFCDSHGNGVYLSERDCSIQRRHQKVIEEAPAPGLASQLRQTMGEAALDAARAIDYRGAGTVEFLVDADQHFYFMEMNTRLQVEHPVTEMITGLDLVEWQLRVAAGEALPLGQEQIEVRGHAMEARIYAEDPAGDFLPSTGRIHYLRTPGPSAALRVDTGVTEGSVISPYYDPMIAKLVVHGSNREDARRRLAMALGEFHVAGLASNIGFLQKIARHHAFAQEDLDTGFIERHHGELFDVAEDSLVRNLAAACITLSAHRAEQNLINGDDAYSPWADADGWRMNREPLRSFEILADDEVHRVELVSRDDVTRLCRDGTEHTIRGEVSGQELNLELDGRRWRGVIARHEQQYTVFWEDGSFNFSPKQLYVGSATAAAGDAAFHAPMHGTVVAQMAKPGARLEAGDPVIVIEAMKMEQTLRAPSAGVVEAFHYDAGDLVDRGAALVTFTPEATS